MSNILDSFVEKKVININERRISSIMFAFVIGAITLLILLLLFLFYFLIFSSLQLITREKFEYINIMFLTILTFVGLIYLNRLIEFDDIRVVNVLFDEIYYKTLVKNELVSCICPSCHQFCHIVYRKKLKDEFNCCCLNCKEIVRFQRKNEKQYHVFKI